MLSKYDQRPLLCSQLCDESRIQGKFPDVSFIASVEEDGSKAVFPVLI